jgi:GT2 family glycosyltransferase
VDNASADGSFEGARKKFPQAFFVKNSKNIGFAAGNNIGIRLSLQKGAEYVLLLNNDTLVKPDFLGKLIDVFKKTPRAGIASPIILDKKGKVWFSGGRIDWLRMRTVHLGKVFSKNPYHSQFITGCAICVKKEVFRKIGLLDEDFFLYYEDADFSLRARKTGFENIVVPSSRITHLERSRENWFFPDCFSLKKTALAFGGFGRGLILPQGGRRTGLT